MISELESKAAGKAFRDFSARMLCCRLGGYGEGDTIIGVRTPDIRALARERRGALLRDIETLLKNKTHEARMLALLILSARYGEDAVKLYLANTRHVNNWDLVDASAHKLVGRWCFESDDYSTMRSLADSPNMWEQRIAMVATWHATRNGNTAPAVEFAEKFLSSPHDILHKAAGWMLRETGKKNPGALLGFLDAHAGEAPRTMLRYAIERLPAAKRLEYMRIGKA
ncbi:MAG: DNA alkylation repair protein [Rickettsiales bacterium]|nr:DNA alkylation repair protein [Rickettsiales bacterium]